MQWYEDEVRALERSNSKRPPGEAPPVFYGSSSFRLWDTLAEDVGPEVLDLAFGGSTLEACNYFFERLVPPVHPRSLLLYAGDNDLGDGRSVDQVLGWFRELAEKVHRELGPIPFGFVSVKPSPARFSIIDRIEKLNEEIRGDIEARESGYYVDIFPAMLNEEGKPNTRYFREDGLHLNREGYKLWGQLLQPYRKQIFID